MDQAGKFITFEGGEGAGKSTQITRLATWLESYGVTVCLTREPGGTEGAELIRNAVLKGNVGRWDPLAELFLMMAARTDHVRKLVAPELDKGRWVISDRFHDSSRVYQGVAGDVGLDVVDRLHEPVLKDIKPDLTIILDVDVEIGLGRRDRAGNVGRFEMKGREFHQKVRDGFGAIAALEPERIVIVPAEDDPDTVAAKIRTVVTKRFDLEQDFGE